MRLDGREDDALRKIHFELGALPYAEGSCLVQFGNTKVICSASVEERVPPFLRHSGKGWVTAEYGMLPRATHTRNDREALRSKQGGRTVEIQRLIGRALRASMNTAALGERQIKIDCDVLQADGGTRTASITGGYIALFQACLWLKQKGLVKNFPLTERVAALSCGILKNKVFLDLNYEEDSVCDTDANFVITARGNFVDVQASAEGSSIRPALFTRMLKTAETGLQQVLEKQRKIVESIGGAKDILAKTG